jgi:hypothetical protein
MLHGHLDYFQKSPLRGRPNIKLGDHGTPNVNIHCFILFDHVWRPSWIEIHQNSIWKRAGHIRLHTTLEDPWPHYMVWEVSWDGLLNTFFWTLIMSWSRLLACVWSGPNRVFCNVTFKKWVLREGKSAPMTLMLWPAVQSWRRRCTGGSSV